MVGIVAFTAAIVGCSSSEDVSSSTSTRDAVAVLTSTPVPPISDTPQTPQARAVLEFGDPAEVELPVVETSETLVWLEGDGATAARMVQVSEPLLSAGSASCDAVAGGLDDLGSPAEVLGAAAETPDPVTSEILVSLHRLLGEVLGSCDDEAAFGDAAADFSWQWALAARRLEEIGVQP